MKGKRRGLPIGDSKTASSIELRSVSPAPPSLEMDSEALEDSDPREENPDVENPPVEGAGALEDMSHEQL